MAFKANRRPILRWNWIVSKLFAPGVDGQLHVVVGQVEPRHHGFVLLPIVKKRIILHIIPKIAMIIMRAL